MADYIANFDPRMEALVPTAEQLQQLAADFRVFYQKVPTSDGGYTMDHTATVYLMDAEGSFAGTIAFGEAAETREAKLRRLLVSG
jgi:protein SCO1/2